MAMNSSSMSFRGKDWLFNALWAPGSDPSAPQCTVRIPLTILFHQGQPFKGLETNEASEYVQRVNFEEAGLELERSMDEVRLSGQGNRLMRLMRKLLLDYASKHKYMAAQNVEEPFVCTVTYTDGEREDLNLRTLDLLMRNEPWRSQVLLVQGYVPTISKVNGRYSDDGVKKVRSKLESDGAEAADKLTKALAKFAEKVYASTTGGPATLGRSREAAQREFDKLGRKAPVELKLVVKELYASFALDPQERVVFLYSDYTTVELDSGRREAEDYLAKEKTGREKTAARAVHTELLGLLQHAQRRGLSTAESFAHFDTQRNGYVDTDMLVDGLGRLGIGVTYQVAEMVLELIGGMGAAFLSIQDFDRFLRIPSDMSAFSTSNLSITSSSSTTTATALSPISKKKGASTSSSSTASQLFPPPKPPRSPSRASTSSPTQGGGAGTGASAEASVDGASSFSLSLQDSQDFAWDLSELSPTHQKTSPSKLGSGSGGGGGGGGGGGASGHYAAGSGGLLPLPSEAYTSNAPKDKTIQLPSWTSRRNKKALKELKSSHEKWSVEQEQQAKNNSSKAKDDLASSSGVAGAAGAAGAATTNNTKAMASSSTQQQRRAGSPQLRNPSPPGSRGGSRGGASSRNGGKRHGGGDKAGSLSSSSSLSLVNIRKDMTPKLGKNPDELLHLESGTVMTYRVSEGSGFKDIRTKEETEIFRYKSVLEVREKNLNEIGRAVHGGVDGLRTSEEAANESKSSAASGTAAAPRDQGPGPLPTPAGTLEYAYAQSDGRPDRWVAFTLVLIPDLFMTVETMQKAFEPLLTKYPHARIVCVGLPGLPNTVWQNGWVLSADLHARSIAKLLQNLKDKNRITPYKGEPIFMMAFGTGAYSMSRFASLYAKELPWFSFSIKAYVMVNGILRYNKPFKQICRDLRNIMMTATAHEANELITSLHFFDEFLVKNDKEKVLKDFWLPRRGLVADGFADDRHGQAFVGVLEMVKAILVQPDDFDGAQMLVASTSSSSASSDAATGTVPLLVVQGTEDVFVDPHNAAMFQADRLPPERTLVTDMADCLDEGAVHVSWLKAGHEIIQERTPFLLGLVSNLAQMCGIHPSEEAPPTKEVEDDDIFDVLENNAKKRAADKAAQEAAAEEERVRAKEAAREEKRRRKAEKEARREEERLALQRQIEEEEKIAQAAALAEAAAQAAAEALQAAEADEDDVDGGGQDQDLNDGERIRRNQLEKERRAKLAVERRKREAREKRKAAMAVFYERERLEKERKQEGRETMKMIKEDKRSKHAEDYRKYMANTARHKRIAQKKAEALKAARREEAIKRVEDKLNRERALRSEERRRKAEEAAKSIESEVLILAGQQAGGYDLVPEGRDTSGIMALILSTHRVLTDLMECRQKSVESMRRQVLVEEKYNVFRKQLASVEHESRMLRQAIRIIETNPLVIGKESGGSKGGKEELYELRRSLAAKEETLSELSAVSQGRERQLSAANRSVQMLKMAIRERDERMNRNISEMQALEEKLTDFARTLRNKKEAVVEKRDKVKLHLVLANEKVRSLQQERKRIADHKGKLVDTDAWVGGVMQRAHTKDLKAFLKQAQGQAEEKAQAVRAELAVMRDEIFDLDDRANAAKRDSDKIGVACRSFLRTFKKISAVSVVDVLKNLTGQREGAEKSEGKKQVEAKLQGLMDDAMASSGGGAGSGAGVDQIEVVRLKDFDLRTKDERKFVGMDLILNPEAYMHISMVDAEQMRFDDDYQCDLAKTDLDRIKNLPPQINLALPFLHTPSEVVAHRLFNKFCRCLTDSDFASKDYCYEGGSMEGDDDSEAPPRPGTGAGKQQLSAGAAGAAGVTPKDLAEADVVHDILVRESRRDRVRAKGSGEQVTEEERNWLQIDHIISPSIFGVIESTTYEDVSARLAATIEKDLSSNVMHSPTHDRITQPAADSKAHQRAMLRENKITGDRDGDVYQELRWRHEDGELVFDDSWRCPFSAMQCLEIGHRVSMDGATDEELKVRRLMDKYYVSEDESTLGHARLQTLTHTINKISNFIQESDRDADADQRQKAVERAALRALDGVKVSADEAAAQEQQAQALALQQQQQKNKNKKAGGSKKGAVKRIWGSWEQIHPASAGVDSQTNYFMKSAFDPSRDHPASYGLHDEVLKLEESNILTDNNNNNSNNKNQMPEGAALRGLAMDTLTALPGSAPMSGAGGNFDTHQNDPNSSWLIVENTRELSLMDVSRVQGKIVLIALKEPLVLFDAKELKLEARQSRAHRFELPNRDDARVLDITISIIFQGNFANKGYKLGRLAAALFRLPDEKDKNASLMPEPVGYAPYDLQSPNLPEHMGRVVILHRPKSRPLRPGFFQLVLGTASSTKYSVEVTARVAQAALPIVDKGITDAKQQQSRLPNILHELDDLQESLRLAERKLLVCSKMITEAEHECVRCQRSMAVINHKLEVDDEEMTMLEDERREHERELGILEVEYGQWATVFASRNREQDDIKEGIKLIFEYQRRRQQEKKKIKADLDNHRHDLPACIAALRGITEATNVASALNTTVQGASAAWAATMQGDSSGVVLRTPAEEVRRHLKREGFKSLTLEEQQWCMLDQAVNSHKYEWLREQEEEEDAQRLAMGKGRKDRKFNAAIEAFRLPAVEIKNIMRTPFSMLSRREVIIRKLMVKYHDDPSVIQKKFAAVAYGFDPHIAERTRAKMPASYTAEEREWASVDRVLHPEVWAYYVNHHALPSDTKGKLGGEDDKDKDKDKSKSKKALNNDTSPAKSNPAGASKKGTGGEEQQQGQGTGKMQTASAMGKILGIKGLENQTGGGDLQVMISGAQQQLVAQAKANETWRCPFDKDRIFRIWKSSKHRLTSDDERQTFKLLQKYNGTYQAYMEAIEEKERRGENAAKAGSHVRWNSNNKTPTLDIDLRAREVLHELDRAMHSQAEYMSSDVLHTSDQMFPTPVLRIQLEEELDYILSEQIRDRERAERSRVEDDGDDESESDDDDEALYVDPSLEGEERDAAMATMNEKIQKRAKRRQRRALKLKGPDVEKEIVAVKKKLNVKGKSGRELEEIHLMNQLGFGGCLACRSNPCKWETGVDKVVVEARLDMLNKESERVRLLKDQYSIESEVCLSAQGGGNKIFRRMDLIEELRYESDELDRQLHLDAVDKELHDAYASRSEFIEVKSLHGYTMMLWVNNARSALSARQDRLVAISVAKEAVDDILDWMLEGWYFGERESNFPVLGRVPSVASDPAGFIRPGQDQIKAVAPVIAKMKKRKAAKKAGIVLPEAMRGLMEDKAAPIEEDKEMRMEKIKVARDGNRHETMLNETERTLKFGLFMLSLMYFRAMAFVKREQRSWSGDDDEITGNGKPKVKIMTDERMLMLDEENKAAARKKKVDAVLARCKIGEQRRIDRENAERREAVLELQKLVRRQKLEMASVNHIQRAYRGHLGRKAAKRWALKRAELGAMHALLHATAICIQRCYRGYLARVNAARKRAEMAAFIALMRAQEAKSDEEVFWATHPWQRFKRDKKEWYDKKLRSQHKVMVLGGARLSEEEQEDLVALRMDQVNDAVNEGIEFDSDSEGGDGDGGNGKASKKAEGFLDGDGFDDDNDDDVDDAGDEGDGQGQRPGPGPGSGST